MLDEAINLEGLLLSASARALCSCMLQATQQEMKR